MLREIGDALDVLTADEPLVLILEDLHWSDCSTLDLVSYLARQRQAAKLMLIGTYRPVELAITGHPLKSVKQELVARRQCEELPLDYLTADSVASYLSLRFPGHRFPEELANLIHQRTEGNPLFMVNAVDYLVTEQSIRKAEPGWQLAVDISQIDVGVPDGIRQMIEKHLDHLSQEQQRMLEAASVAGNEFSPLAVAEISGEDGSLVEDWCNDLAREHRFIQDCGFKEAPGGEVVARYGFVHALYQNVLYDRLSASRRIQLHRRMGELGERQYGERAGEIATELAMHFERGAKFEAAVKYLQKAAENGIRRFAYRGAVELAQRGLELLGRLPDTKERAEQELWLQITLGVPLIATRGYAAPEVCSAYTRARELCRRLGDTPEISNVLWGLWLFYLLRAELGTTREIAEEFLQLAERLSYSGLEMRGHFTMEVTLIHLGEFEKAIEHFEKALVLYDPEQQRDESLRYSQNSGVGTKCHAAWALWIIGRPDRALERIDQALQLAQALSEPHGLAHACFFAAILHQLRREVRRAQDFAEAGIAISRKHELVLYEAMATIVRGWALTEQGNKLEGIEQMREGIAAHKATGTEVLLPHFLALLAEALGKDGQADEGLRQLEEALAIAHRNGDRYYEAELYRIKGELLLVRTRGLRSDAAETIEGRAEAETTVFEQVESCFRRSFETARQQKAESWKLRAAMSLSHLYEDQGRRGPAYDLLSETYNSFHEGFDTADLREAKALLVRG
jgi:predicted ATPase